MATVRLEAHHLIAELVESPVALVDSARRYVAALGRVPAVLLRVLSSNEGVFLGQRGLVNVAPELGPVVSPARNSWESLDRRRLASATSAVVNGEFSARQDIPVATVDVVVIAPLVVA
jgi:hypothetical protein